MAGNHTWEDFVASNLSVLIIFILVIALVLIVFFVDRRWRRQQTQLEKVTGIMNESHAFSLNLVRHFMPSYKVAKYQFRGMKPKKNRAGVEFENLGLDLKSGKRVLNGVTGQFEAGKMCAIMGPSGAGKTTFMNTLCGKATYGNMVGTMRINGKETNPQELKEFMGFVPQDDIVHQDLTVREQIQFSVRLRGSTDLSKRRIEFITEDVLNVMQIDHIQNSIVGSVENRGISGGQRKRVNIGLELAAEPTLLFLDEPTSGLDSTSSLAVCLSLQKLCQLGMTSIMVIHQPRYSLFTLFDLVLLLGKGGETVFLGSSMDAKSYFESLGFEMPQNENPADWFMDVLSGEVSNNKIQNFKPDMLFALWRERHDRESNDLEDGDNARAIFRKNAASRQSRMLSPEEDKAVLARNLQDGWETVDVNRDGVMDSDELKELLAHCAGMMPTDEVVGELMVQMAGGEQTKVITKEQFLEYLSGLSEDVARDENLRNTDATGVTGPHARMPLTGNKDLTSESSESEVSSSDGMSSASSTDSAASMLGGTSRPGFFGQLRILTLRRLVQWWRMNRQRALFFSALALGGIVLAVLDGYIVGSPAWDAMAYLNLHTCLALLLSIFVLNVFGAEQPVFWRESASGINVPAYFQAKVLVNTIDIVLMTFGFTSIYYLIRQPYIAYWRFFVPFIFTSYAASGWGYLISTIVPPQHGPFIVSLVSFIVCGLLGNPTTLESFREIAVMDIAVSAISISRWAVQMSFLIANDVLKPNPGNDHARDQAMLYTYKNVYVVEGQSSDTTFWHAAIALFAMGFVLRILAFLGLKFTNRSKQV